LKVLKEIYASLKKENEEKDKSENK